MFIEERFWQMVEKTENCWNWKGSVGNNYGMYYVNGKSKRAHRIAFELLASKIPDGLTLDHLCKNTLCVNPKHLEPVTLSENSRRENVWKRENVIRTRCEKGHPWKPENIRKTWLGYNECNICKKDYNRKYHVKNIEKILVYSKLWKRRKRAMEKAA